jgi:predicted nucleic acid-binding protein
VGAVTAYLDVNVMVPLFAVDTLTDRAKKALRSLHDDLIMSDFAIAEFSSVIARRVRTRDLRPDEARAAFSNFDSWCARHVTWVKLESIDIVSATALMRRLDLSVRTRDALHIAIVQRIGCPLLTFDRTMASVARALGIELVKN